MDKENLEEAISEFIESCHRTGHHDIEDNIHYFMRENNHMKLDRERVEDIFYELDR